MSDKPTFGHTSLGHEVHARTLDHLPEHNAYARFNKRVALAVTRTVGSMTCAWVFCGLAVVSLPAVLALAFHVTWFPHWLISAGLIALVAWIAQTFLQLVLLSVIMVGQDVQSRASDARAAKTFEDTEAVRSDVTTALDRLDTRSQGGLRDILDAVAGMQEAILAAVKTTPAGADLEEHIDAALTAHQEKIVTAVTSALPASRKTR